MDNTGKELGDILWEVADSLRGKMMASNFQDYMLSFLFLYYISNKYISYVRKVLGKEYNDCEKECEELNNKDNTKTLTKIKEDFKVKRKEFKGKEELYEELITSSTITPLTLWYLKNIKDVDFFEKIIRKKIHYTIMPQYLWHNIYAMAKNESPKLLEILQNEFSFIENKSFNTSFKGLFSEINLNSEKLGKEHASRNLQLCKIIGKIGDELLKVKINSDIGNDILGDAYEFLISKFASNSGAKAGEFYTPQQVSTILSEIVTRDSQDSILQKQTDINGVLDFACGSGSLLINVKKHIDKINEENNSNIKISHIYGQENNITTYNLARMNMILHGIKDNEFEIFHGDTLANEWGIFSEKNPAKKIECDIVVANPPFSLIWEHKDDIRDDFRFAGYGLAPRSAADFAFLLHGFHFLSMEGTMAIILPHGVLFRGGEEAKIRKKLIDDDNIDTVIGLPANLFYSTGIPVCIIVLKKCKKEDDILFINADKLGKKEKNRKVLEEKDIKKIVDTYIERKEEDIFSKRVSKDKIIENDYNLNISRYVSTAEEDKKVDLRKVQKELIDIEEKIKVAKKEHNKFLKELGLPELP